MSCEPKDVSCEPKDISDRDLRFLMTVVSSMTDEDTAAMFIINASKRYAVKPEALTLQIAKEIDDDFEFKEGEDVAKPGTFPRIFGGIQSFGVEPTREREKLGLVADIVRYGKETIDELLDLMDMPEINYCWFCKQLGYNKDHYLNHNFKGGHNNEVICPATYFMHAV